jgi:hypothetical protein
MALEDLMKQGYKQDIQSHIDITMLRKDDTYVFYDNRLKVVVGIYEKKDGLYKPLKSLI